MISQEKVVVRSASDKDLAEVVQIHLIAFPSFFLTQLGPRFLNVYYSTVLEYSESVFLLALADNCVLGFAAGFVKPNEFYRKLGDKRMKLACAIMPRLLRSPKLSVRVIRNMFEMSARSQNANESAELASIAVAKNAVREGIGKRLLAEFCGEVFARGADQVYLTTDSEGNDSVNQFYRDMGFAMSDSFAQGHRMMNRYVKAKVAQP